MSLPPRLLSGALVSVAGRAVGTALSVVTIGVITKHLAAAGGVEAYGAYATIFAFLWVVAIAADGGLYLTFTKKAARLHGAEEARLLQVALTVRLGTLFLAIVAVWGIVLLLGYPLLVRQGILLGSFGIAAQLTTQLVLGVFQKRLRMSPPAAGEVVGRGVTLALAVFFAWSHGGILAFVGAFVAGALFTLAWNLHGVRRLLPASFLPTVRLHGWLLGFPPGTFLETARSLVREAWPLALLLVCWMIVFRADSILLSYLQPLEELGWYALPYKVLESALFFPAMMGGLLFPVLSRSASACVDHEGFRRTLAEATDLFLLLAIPAVILLVWLAPSIIHVLGGSAFAPSVPALQILAVALGALFFGNLYGNSAIALGEQRSLLVAAFLLAVVNVAVNLLVIPRFSFIGAAWTTLATEFLSACSAGVIVFRRVGRLPTSAERWRILCAGGVFLLVVLLPLPTVARALAGVSAYVGALSVLGVLSRERVRSLVRSQVLP